VLAVAAVVLALDSSVVLGVVLPGSTTLVVRLGARRLPAEEGPHPR
jgi:hypothetical protein